MATLIKRIEQDLLEAIPAIVFFIITFNIIHLSEILALRPGDKSFTGFFGATLGAIVAGKVIILARSLPFIDAFPKKPLIYNISWKFFIFGSVAILVELLDFIVKKTWYDNFTVAIDTTMHILQLPFFWSIQIWVLLLFFFFVVFSEYTHVLGEKKVVRILLG